MRNIVIIVSILVVPFVTLVGLSAAGLIPDAPRLYGRIPSRWCSSSPALATSCRPTA